jgi:hypothetical protein
MKSKKYINEEIETSNENFLNYIAVIDATEILQNNRSMINFLFPDVKINKLINWYASLAQSDVYNKKDKRSKLESINSRFYGDGTLKLLYRSLNALINEPYTEPEKVDRDSDVKKMIKKISIYIQKKLTDDDKEVIGEFFSELEKVASKINDKIESVLLSSMKSEEKPEEEPSKETEEQPEETKVNERLKNKIRKKIREMVRTVVINKRFNKQ